MCVYISEFRLHVVKLESDWNLVDGQVRGCCVTSQVTECVERVESNALDVRNVDTSKHFFGNFLLGDNER